MILGRLWGISAQLSALCFFYPPSLPSLSSRTLENHSVETVPIFFFPSQSRQGGKGGIIMPLDYASPSVEGRQRQEQTPRPYLAP